MKFIKLFCYDLKHGLLRSWKKYAGVVLMSFAFFLFFAIQNSAFNRGQAVQGLPRVNATYGDTVFYIFAGMAEYVPEPTTFFRFPMIWMLLYIVLAWITLEYAHNDLVDYGQQVLIRTNGRTMWWLSKCVWNACSVLGFFGVIWLTLLLFCLAAGYPITLTLHADLLGNILNASVTGTGSADVLLLATFLLTPLVLMALNLLQMTFTMFVKPIAGFCITTALLILSAYQISPLLIGNYAMPMRSTAFLSTGVDLQTGILYALVLAGIAVAVGAVRFRHYDILEIE